MSVTERLRITRMAVDRSRRSTVSRLLTPFQRWRYSAPAAAQLIIVPQDLRTADPSFWHEIELGQFGLAGTNAELRGKSPFELRPPNQGWARELYGFAWLRHLDAAGNEEAREAGRRLAVEWTIRQSELGPVAHLPSVAARRLISWLSHTGLLLEGADAGSYEAITQSLAAQVARLSTTWRDEADGYPRLLALIALVLADLTIAGHDAELASTEQDLAHELSRQILADGGHISRNPAVLVEIVLDLLPLRQCFASRGRTPPEQLNEALARIPAMLRFMRLGDGSLARFNGVSVAETAGLATVLAYHDVRTANPGLAQHSRYARLSRGTKIVMMDAGSPPPLLASAEASAGCLAFEMSSGLRPLVVNGGAPGPSHADWRDVARASASHNTLVLKETSSSELVRNKRLEQLTGSPPISGPSTVEARVTETPSGGLEAIATHDGYRERYGLLHSRRLMLSADGRRLEGTDRLAGARVRVRLRQDLPFAIHFHLHPEASCRILPGNAGAEIRLGDGQLWYLRCPGVAPAIEDSTYFADAAGPRSSLQIVLRGATFGETDVSWTLEAGGPAGAA